MTRVERQRRLNKLLHEAAQSYERLNDRQVRFAVREIDRTRHELNTILLDYANKDGIIPRNRINTMLRDLDTIEDNIRKYGVSAVDTIIKESAEYSTRTSEAAVVRALGQSAGIGITFNRINNRVFEYMTKRFDAGGLVLSDVVWNLAGEQRDELTSVIRNAIIRGQDVKTTTAQVRKVYDNETWKIRRLVVTEGNTAYRVANTYYAERSDVVKALQIHDIGGHRNHENHACYILAHQNPYGLGMGVYPADDERIYSPHPNCRAYLTYVIDEGAVS